MSSQSPQKYLVFFPCFTFLHRNTVVEAASFPLITYCTSCGMTRRPVGAVEQLWFLSTERSERRIFIIVATPRICETSKREGWMFKTGITFNLVCVYKIYMRAVATSGRPQRSLQFFPFSLYSINFFQPGFTCTGVPQISNWLNPTLNEGLQQVEKK